MRNRVKCSGLDTNINRVDDKSRETEKKKRERRQKYQVQPVPRTTLATEPIEHLSLEFPRFR